MLYYFKKIDYEYIRKSNRKHNSDVPEKTFKRELPHRQNKHFNGKTEKLPGRKGYEEGNNLVCKSTSDSRKMLVGILLFIKNKK